MRGRPRLIAVVAGLVVLLILVYFFLIRPKQGDLSDLRAQVATEQNTTTALQSELQRLKSFQENAGEINAALATIRELVPQKDQVPNFIFQVQDAADESGVDFFSVTPELPKPPPEGASLAEVRVAISATGGFFSIQDFVRRLYELDRALRIDLVTLRGEEGPDGGIAVTLDMTARIFFELPAEGVDPGAATTTTPTTPPGGTEPSPSPTSLEPTSPGADSSPSPNLDT